MTIEEIKSAIEKYEKKSEYFKKIGFMELSKDFESFTAIAKSYLEEKQKDISS